MLIDKTSKKIDSDKDRELLITDLFARIQYGVICQLSSDGITTITEKLQLGGLSHFLYQNLQVKPYLRPMSSMTEEECNEFFTLAEDIVRCGKRGYSCGLSIAQINWLNSHFFDYNGLIEKGLALEASKDMYK